MSLLGATALWKKNLRLCEWFFMGLGVQETHTVFKVWTDLSSGHKCQLLWHMLSELEAAATIKSQFIFPCVNREQLIVGDGGRVRQQGPFALNESTCQCEKYNSFVLLLYFSSSTMSTHKYGIYFYPVPDHTHPKPFALFLSLVCYQWEPSCCQIHSLCTVKASPVKLLKWHYCGQFFSLYLKCLNVWQTNQSLDPANTSCMGGQRDMTDPFKSLRNWPGIRNQDILMNFAWVSSSKSWLSSKQVPFRFASNL